MIMPKMVSISVLVAFLYTTIHYICFSNMRGGEINYILFVVEVINILRSI